MAAGLLGLAAIPFVSASTDEVAALPAGGVSLQLAVADIEGEGWAARGLAVEIRQVAAGASVPAVIRIERLELPGEQGTLRDMQLECPLAQADEGGWRCPGGTLRIGGSPIGAQTTQWRGHYRPDAESILEVPGLGLAGGAVSLALSGRGRHWRLRLEVSRLEAGGLARTLGAAAAARDWSPAGRLSGKVELDYTPAGLGAALDLHAAQFAYANADGTQAAESVEARVRADLRESGSAWSFDGRVEWTGGGLYSEPLFVDAGTTPVTATAVGRWRPPAGRLELDTWTLTMPGVVDLTGTGRLRWPGSGSGPGSESAPGIEEMTLVARSDAVDRLYPALLQPFLLGTPADDLEAGGRIGLVVRIDAAGAEQLGLELTDLVLADRQGRFSLDSTTGSLAWDRTREVPESRLHVAGASLLRIPVGAFSVRVQFSGDRLDLAEPVPVPVLDGRVVLEAFAVRGMLRAGEAPAWSASAVLENLSLAELTQAFEWPPFAGSVNARLRDLRYADRRFEAGDPIEVEAFEGRLRIERLSILEPLGTAPVLEADATLRNLSLDAVTETFALGRIEGRLDGEVRDIRLVGWRPDQFDLHLYTPPDDDSRRRISQRAVENLTELGSGVPAGLSAGVLSIFESFGYRRIELEIELDGNRAEMGGLAREEGGYYLVQGAGLPRIDVIGRNRSVAWKDLLERLQQIRVDGAQIR
jgi:hypothetical protein